MLPVNIKNKLDKLGQRKLVKGELFLLAYVIGLKIKLPKREEDNLKLYVISKQSSIEEVIYTLNEFTYIDETAMTELYNNITRIIQWRFSLAYDSPVPIFSDTDEIIDDLSLITRYIDQSTLCSLKDISDSLNTFMRLLKDFVDATYSE